MAEVRKSLAELYKQAERENEYLGFRAHESIRRRYHELMVEHGHIVPREPGDDGSLPCGWSPSRRD